MQAEKAQFLKDEFIPLLKCIPADAAPRWGRMNVQQMVEHFTDAVHVAAGQFPELPVVTPVEHLPKMQAFIMSDKPFRENTRNPLLPEIPLPVRHLSMPEALTELQAALALFFDYFSTNETATTRNPIFGELDFNLNIRLLYKHVLHHLRQFGVDVLPVGS